jgi:hypothetical protein
MTTNTILAPLEALEQKRGYLERLIVDQRVHLHLLEEELALLQQDSEKYKTEIQSLKEKIKANKESELANIQEHIKLTTRLGKRLNGLEVIKVSIENAEDRLKRSKESHQLTLEELDDISKQIDTRGKLYGFKTE